MRKHITSIHELVAEDWSHRFHLYSSALSRCRKGVVCVDQAAEYNNNVYKGALNHESGYATTNLLPHKIWAIINNIMKEAEDLGTLAQGENANNKDLTSQY